MFKRSKSHLTLAFTLLTVLMLFISGCAPQGSPATNHTMEANRLRAAPGSTTCMNQCSRSFRTVSPRPLLTWLIKVCTYRLFSLAIRQGHINPGLATEIPTVANGDVSLRPQNLDL